MEVPHEVSISRIQIDAAPRQTPLWLKVCQIFFTALVLFTVLDFFVLWLTHASVISWWQKGAPNKEYNRFMSVWTVISSSRGTVFLKLILRAFYPQNSYLTTSQNKFIRQKLFPLRRFVSPATKEQTGFLTPDHLCNSLLLYDDDGDEAFDAWKKKTQPARKLGTRKECLAASCSTDFNLTFESPKPDEQGWYDYKQPKTLNAPNDAFYGVYPGASQASFDDWKGCIQAWANGGLKAEGRGGSYYAWTQGADGMFVLGDMKRVNDDSAWWDVKGQPDNVFARCGIHFNSPLIVGFVNQKYSIRGTVYHFNSAAFLNLIGGGISSTVPGGWVGFLAGFGSDASLDDFQSQCFEDVDYSNNPNLVGPPCNKALNTAGGIAGALGTGGLYIGQEVKHVFGPEAIAWSSGFKGAFASRLGFYGAVLSAIAGTIFAGYQGMSSC